MLRTTCIDLKPQAAATTTDTGNTTGTIVAVVFPVAAVIGVVTFVVVRRRPKSVEAE
jgi:hypothetical protein